VSVALLSGVVNMLMLAGPLYMLQIYDRVLSSRSVPTLIALSVFLVLAYGFQAALEVIRTRLVVRIASLLDVRLGTTVHDAVIRLAIQNRSAAEAHQPLRDLDQIRTILTRPGPIAIVDLPWAPIFLAICFLIHPCLASAFGGAGTAGLDDPDRKRSRGRRGHGARCRPALSRRRTSRRAATVIAMGAATTLAERWRRVNDRYWRQRRASTSSAVRQSVENLAAPAAVGDAGPGAYLRSSRN
jgi:ATP-binding cassette subfamily C protein